MRRIVAAVVGVIFSATFLVGGLSSRPDVPEYASANARGTIDDVWVVVAGYEEGESTCSTLVRFDAQRRQWPVTGPPEGATSAACHLEPGGKLEVRYDPGNPRAAVVAHDLDAEAGKVLTAIGVVCLVLTVMAVSAMTLLARRPQPVAAAKPKPKRKRKSAKRRRKRR
jgi:hypothetical protein